eukprot:227168_1
MPSDFQSRFMNRMEHITKSGQTSTQQRSTTATPNIHFGAINNTTPTESVPQIPQTAEYVSTPAALSVHSSSQYNTSNSRSNMSNAIANNFFQQNETPYTPSQHQQSLHSNNGKLTAQQFQNYLNDFSPPHHIGIASPDPEYHQSQSYNPFTYSENNNLINADFTQPHYQDTQSEQFTRKYNTYARKPRTKTYSARTTKSTRKHRKRENKENNKNRPVSLEFSRKPRRIQYKPYTLNELQSLAPVNSGHASLGVDFEDEQLRKKSKNMKKVRDYAEIVGMKNKQHRPRQRVQPVRIKSKQEIAKEYAHCVSRVNREKLRKSAEMNRSSQSVLNSERDGYSYRAPPHFKRTGSATLKENNINSQYQSGHNTMQQKLTELQQLHQRNRAIAQHILHDTFG